MKTGKLIVFEGIDGSGKSTQIKRVYDELIKNYSTHLTAQPTKSELGTLLRRYLAGELIASNLVLTTLFASDRLDHISSKDGLLDKVLSGDIVLCDRNYFSSFAYQATDDDFVFEVNRKAREILKPDLHIFIDVEIDEAINRISQGRESLEIFETKEKLTEIKTNYLNAFERFKDEENVVFIDGNKKCDDVFLDIMSKIQSIL